MNSEQRHIIKRQTIELKVEGGIPSQQLQAEISRIYHQRIVPLINEYCTALSAPDHIHRLDLLEIDLGAINIEFLEADLVAKIRATLYQALANQINQQEPAAKPQKPNLKTRSQLELLTFFVQTGNLPWWAETTQPQFLEDCLQYLIQTAPESLRRLMRKWGQEKHLLHRIVFHYEDKLLSKLANLLAPSLNYSLAADPQILGLLLQQSSVAAGKSAIQLKQHIWYIILQVLSLAGTQLSKPDSFYQAVLTRIATELGITYKSLLIAIHQVLPKAQALVHGKLKNILENLYREQVDKTETQPTTPKIQSSLEARQNWLAILQQYAKAMGWSAQEIFELSQIVQPTYRNNFNQSNQPVQNNASSTTSRPTTEVFLDELWKRLEDLIVLLPISLQDKLRHTFQMITNRLARDESSPAAIWQNLLRLLRLLLASQNRHSSSKLDELARQQPVAASDPEFSKELFELTHEIHEILNQEDSTTTTRDDIQLNMNLNEALATLPQHAKVMGWSAQEISELTQIVIQPAYQNNFNQTTEVFLDELRLRLEDVIVRLPISLQNQLRHTFQMITNRLARDESLPAAVWQDLLRLLRPLLASQNRRSLSKLDELARQQPVAASDPEFSKELFELTHEIHETWNQEDSTTTTTNDLPLNMSLSEALAILPQHAKAMGWSAQEISELTQIVQLRYHNNFNNVLSTTPQPTTEVFLDDLWMRLKDFIVPLPISLQNQLRHTFQMITNRLTRDESLPAAIWQDLLRLLRPLLASQNQRSPNELDELVRRQPVAAPEPEFSKELFELTHEIHETLNQEDSTTTTTDDLQFDLSFSEADELYISNAGLVILWPFLNHFFTHLDLLAENKQFKNFATMQRAVALLQYLAIENDNFPEYWLALNKVLCGMAITDVYHLDSPLLESEMSECTTLLKAVITQAPILRDMSESGLRGTFLLRAGVLSTRDGAWLLRVERETYDIVLDRFPWSWVWVKLPWMDTPLRVEW